MLLPALLLKRLLPVLVILVVAYGAASMVAPNTILRPAFLPQPAGETTKTIHVPADSTNGIDCMAHDEKVQAYWVKKSGFWRAGSLRYEMSCPIK